LPKGAEAILYLAAMQGFRLLRYARNDCGWVFEMASKHFLPTPSQAAEKELTLDQFRMNPRVPRVKGRKTSLPKAKVKVIPGGINSSVPQGKSKDIE
jgi:hypothetical protein